MSKFWSECSGHHMQISSVMVDQHQTETGNGAVFLRVNCVFCGCPGEVIVPVDRDEIEWEVPSIPPCVDH